VALRPPTAGKQHIDGELWLTSPDDQADAIRRCRRLLDLDAAPSAVDGRLAADPVLAPLVAAAPGRRVPGAVDPAELAVRAVLGQQVSTAAARTHAARLVVAHGELIDDPAGGLTSVFPETAALQALDPATLALPESRKRTLLGLVRALAEGTVDLDLDLNARPGVHAVERVRAQLLALPGFGPWTVETIAMRAFGDPDAFLAGDLGVRIAAEKLGLPTAPAALTSWSRRWSPFRAYAVQHLWATGGHAVNRLPADDEA
jgi:AraC family transcriptional regulator of adaptative response / DNA-3-methyladenine glycosylase II